MDFENALESTASAANEKEFNEILQRYMFPGEIGEKSLWSALSKLFPDSRAVDIMIVDSDERQNRQNLSNQMRDKMTAYLTDSYHSAKERESWTNDQQKNLTKDQQNVMQNRAWTFDTLLKLPHPEQTEEYQRRYDILAKGTPEQKRNLLFEELHKLRDKYTREALAQMTDEEIVNNFEDLELLQGFVNGAATLSRNDSLELDEKQQQELLDFCTEFDPISLVFNRAKLIADPSYSLVRAERLPEFNVYDVDAERLANNTEKQEALKSLLNGAGGVQGFAQPYLESEVMRRMGTQYTANQIQWLDANGNPLSVYHNFTTGTYTPPLSGLLDGKPLTGVLPDGTKKTVHIERLQDGGITMKDGMQEKKKKDRFAGMSISDIATTLYEQMDACDPWYVISSNEFSNAKFILYLLQRRANGTTEEDMVQLRMGLSALKMLSERYLNAKTNKTSYSKREQERRAVMEDIAEFVDMRFRDELGLHGMYEGHADFAENLSGSEEHTNFAENLSITRETTAEKQDSILGGDVIDEPDDVSFEESSAPEGLYDEKIEQYTKMDCKPLDEKNHALQDLQKDAVEAAKALAAGGQSAMLGRGSEPFWKTRMAQLTLFHMVMIERSSSKSAGKPGLIENALNGHKEAMVQDICNNPDFVSAIGKLTPERISRFLLTDEARDICKNIITKSVNAVKNHTNPEPEMHAQKTMENPMPKM